MASEMNHAEPVAYAAFRLRFRALVIDFGICLGSFVMGGIAAGILFENSTAGRVAVFVALLVGILAYEPFMVARYGATLGHRRSNIRIICVGSGANLPLWRATARSFIKQVLGIPSFAFMFVTSRAQGLHDLAAHARVVIRDPAVAAGTDCFRPPPTWTGRFLLTLIRRKFQIREIATGTVSYPQPDLPFLALTQPRYHQAGLFRILNPHAHFGSCNDHLRAEPCIRVSPGTTAFSYCPVCSARSFCQGYVG
jgi:uncharacterized RDD family membrane protein YckC